MRIETVTFSEGFSIVGWLEVPDEDREMCGDDVEEDICELEADLVRFFDVRASKGEFWRDIACLFKVA